MHTFVRYIKILAITATENVKEQVSKQCSVVFSCGVAHKLCLLGDISGI